VGTVRIARYPALNFTRGRAGRTPRGIVVHTNVGSFRSTIAWFADPRCEVSAHYLVGLDGEIAQFVHEADAAWHAVQVHNPSTPLVEDGDAYLYTIGIEFEDGGDPDGVKRTDAQYRAGATLIHSAATRWDIPLDRDHVVGHREVNDARSCPGNLDVDRLVAEALGSS
jgi:N-acetyl-anhydromuramyl-L-alanine amidase AmpD